MKLFRLIITAVLVIAVMFTIFSFSSQSGSESSEMSSGFVDILISRLPGFDELDESEQFRLREQLHFFVRKAAHFTEYAILGFSLILHIYAVCDYISVKPKKAWLPAWVIAAVYACLDEYHQSFTADRSPQIRDVLIDSAGAAAGVLLCMMIFMIYKKKKKQ